MAGLPDQVIDALRCSVCADPVTLAGRTLRCARGHAFDLAKQGYVNLLRAGVGADTADTPAMVVARAEFLDAGHYAPLAALVAEHAEQAEPETRLVLDAGAGTGYYLAEVLDRLPEAHGLALDVSAAALRRAARAHPRAGAAGWNVWQRPWPVGTGAADVLLNVFAPRNPAEFHRVLRPGGTLVVATPGEGHLGELIDRFGLLGVGEDKQARLDSALADRFTPVARAGHTARVTLSPADVGNVIGMGPNAHHTGTPAVTGPVTVTTAFVVTSYRAVPC